MTKIKMIYEGDLQVRALHAPSSTQLVTDAPVDNHGKGRSFSPTDLVATALGSCMATIMGIVAERDKIDLKGMTIEVEKEMAAHPKRRIGKLTVKINGPEQVSEDARKKLIKAAEACPVKASLDPHVQVEVEFSWGEKQKRFILA